LSQTQTALLVGVVVLVLVAIAYAAWQRRRTAQLQERFGPEYDHTVTTRGKRRAVSELRQREKEHAQLDLRPLPPADLERYRARWSAIQSQFVDDPEQAVQNAEQLSARVMSDRGYPTHNFEEGAAQVSVDHPEVAQRYRAAHSLAIEQERGQPTTEELRQAMTAYRSLVEVLLEDGQQQP
jgi:hypothetical protein